MILYRKIDTLIVSLIKIVKLKNCNRLCKKLYCARDTTIGKSGEKRFDPIWSESIRSNSKGYSNSQLDPFVVHDPRAGRLHVCVYVRVRACADNSADGNVQQAIESIHHSIDWLKMEKKSERGKNEDATSRRGRRGETRQSGTKRRGATRLRTVDRQVY